MSTTTVNPCSCGCTEPHVIARRNTFDGIRVQLWSDGAVTCGINTYVAMAPRSAYARRKAVEAGWLVAGCVDMYDHAELRGLVGAARKAVVQSSLAPAAYLAAVLRGVKFQALKKGAVIRHARDCGCAPCVARRAEVLARPEAERLYREMPLANGGSAFIRIALFLLACVSGIACAHGPATVEQPENVGQLAAGPSVYSAPMHHDAPPELVGVVDTGDDIPETGPSAADILRAENAKGGTVQGEEKVAHGF